jgi:hypothetical protein
MNSKATNPFSYSNSQNHNNCGGLTMKAKSTNFRKVLILASFYSVALLSGSFSFAQSDPDLPAMETTEFSSVLLRLEVLMAQFEEDARYVAPTGDYEIVSETMERLEHHADHLENDILYKAPDFASLPDFSSRKKGNSIELLSQTKKSEPIQF